MENFFQLPFRVSHGHLNIKKSRNQPIFELQKSIRCHIKAIEKIYSLIMFLKFSKTLTETITIIILKLTLELGMSMKRKLNNSALLHIIRKTLERGIQ